ncbi:MAG: dihydrodipicolinate synthase family protein [Propionicimonas sp.]
MRSLTGIVVPLVSPIAADGGVDLESVAGNADRVLAAGTQGLYLCGGTGDAAELSPLERRQVVEAAMPVARAHGAATIVHVGLAPLRDALALAEHALAAGADAVASVPLRGDWDQTVRYYRELAALGGPVFVYHMPPAGFHATFDQLSELLEVEGVAGAKVSDWNLFLLRRLVEGYPDRTFYTGLDENLGFGLLAGAHGSIGTWANLVPRFYARVWQAAVAGREAEVLTLHRQWQHFLGLGWSGDIIAAFEALMADRGHATACFRVPAPAPVLEPARLDRLTAGLELIEALGEER